MEDISSIPIEITCYNGHRDKHGYPVIPCIKIVMKKYTDGYVAYPLGLKGVVVGQGDSYKEAMADIKSAIRFYVETFGSEIKASDALCQEIWGFRGVS